MNVIIRQRWWTLKKRKPVMKSDISIRIRTMKLGESFIAGTSVGGMQVRGRRADSQLGAVRNLLWQLGQAETDDMAVGLELALNGETIETAYAQLEGGNDATSDGE